MLNDDPSTNLFRIPKPASLSLEDLLTTEQSDELTEYLALSITPIGTDTQVSITTVDVHPITYSMILHGISAADFPALMGDIIGM